MRIIKNVFGHPLIPSIAMTYGFYVIFDLSFRQAQGCLMVIVALWWIPVSFWTLYLKATNGK